MEQAISICRQVEGSLTMNVAAGEGKSGGVYANKAKRAHAANDQDRYMVNLELSRSHYVEAARIYRAINHIELVDTTLHNIAQIDKVMRRI